MKSPASVIYVPSCHKFPSMPTVIRDSVRTANTLSMVWVEPWEETSFAKRFSYML